MGTRHRARRIKRANFRYWCLTLVLFCFYVVLCWLLQVISDISMKQNFYLIVFWETCVWWKPGSAVALVSLKNSLQQIKDTGGQKKMKQLVSPGICRMQVDGSLYRNQEDVVSPNVHCSSLNGLLGGCSTPVGWILSKGKLKSCLPPLFGVSSEEPLYIFSAMKIHSSDNDCPWTTKQNAFSNQPYIGVSSVLLLREGMSCIVKLNPSMLLTPAR